MAKYRLRMNKASILIFKISRRISLSMRKLWVFVPKSFFNSYTKDKSLSKPELIAILKYELGEVPYEIVNSATIEEKQNWLFLANQTLENKFKVLGSGWVTLEPMVWNIDLRTKQKWEQPLFYLKQRTNTQRGADIKSPWDLSRGHFLLWLGEAYLLTKDEKYAQKVVNLLCHWIENNPVMYTVNWACSMDVAIRAVNWMYALHMISSSAAFTEDFAERVSISLYQHGLFIRCNLEKSVLWSNNHYTSDLIGLLYIGTLFRHTVKGRRWRNFALNEFYDQTRKQILPSGIHYEKSTSYHRLMVELTAYTLAMLKRTGESIPNDVIFLTQKMYDYVGTYIMPSGYAPLLADNDDGRFLPFTCGEFDRHGYLLDAAGIDQRIVNSGITPFFNLGYNGNTYEYQDIGVVFMKKYGTYLLLNNSGFSRYSEGKSIIATHTHNDQLSFVFSIGEDDVIIDPGTYVYTSSIEDRNEFRSTRKHNTAIVDDEEQNVLSGSDAFLMTINNKDRKIWTDRDCCGGSYRTIKGGLLHQRRFEIKNGKLEIIDTLSKKGNGHIGRVFFHLSDKVLPHIENDNVISIISSQNKIRFTLIGNNTDKQPTTEILNDTYSPSYGVLKSTNTIEGRFVFDKECVITTIIEWERK